jgi:hypothetical protein
MGVGGEGSCTEGIIEISGEETAKKVKKLCKRTVS